MPSNAPLLSLSYPNPNSTSSSFPPQKGPRDNSRPLLLYVVLGVVLLATLSFLATPNNNIERTTPTEEEQKPSVVVVPISDFLPERVRLLDHVARGNEPQKFLFRGNLPLLKKTTPPPPQDGSPDLYFAKEELVMALKKTTAEAAGNLTLPAKLFLYIVSLLDPTLPGEKEALEVETLYFDSHGEEGTVISWPLFGDSTDPFSLNPSERLSKALALESWQPDHLIPRTSTLRSIFTAAIDRFYWIDSESLEDAPAGAPHAGFVVYFHCNHGQDRTGELAAAYNIRYLNKTVEGELEYNKKMGMDVRENMNSVRWFGEWWKVNGTKKGG